MMKKNSFRWIYAVISAVIAFAALIMLIFLGLIFVGIASLFIGADAESLDGNVALIAIDGVILGSDGSDYLFESVASSQDIVELVEKADKNPAIKAIIFEINKIGRAHV